MGLGLVYCYDGTILRYSSRYYLSITYFGFSSSMVPGATNLEYS